MTSKHRDPLHKHDVRADHSPLEDVADATSFTHGGGAPGILAGAKAMIHKVEEKLHHEEAHAEPFSWNHLLEE